VTRRWVFWVAIVAIFFLLLFLLRGVLLPFVLGMATAYFLDPIADRMERWGMSRNYATFTLTMCFFLGLILLSILIVPLIADQLMGLIAAIPEYVATFNEQVMPQVTRLLRGMPADQVESIKSAVADSSGAVVKLGGKFIGGIFHSGMTVITLFSLILITPVVAFYLLRDWDNMLIRMDALLPRRHADVIREQLHIIDRTLAGFVRGQLNVCMLLGVFYAVGLTLVGLKFGALIGLLTGFLVIFPYVGLMLGMSIGLGVAFFQFENYGPVAAVLAVFVIGQIIEGYFVTPKLMSSKVGLHPVWIIFGMLAGASLFGFVGILLAIPITAVIGVLIRFSIDRYLQSSLYHGGPAA
jgi:predicted PurR-regulated permease PerM